jgi:hypothetical protein
MQANGQSSGVPASYRKFGLRVAEHWCDAPLKRAPNADLALLQQYQSAPAGAVCTVFHSLELSLRQSEQELLSGLESACRYDVRRAASKDQVVCADRPCDPETLQSFADFYDAFASAKALPLLDRQALRARAQAGLLRLSCARVGDVSLAWHAHIVSGNRAVLLHSASVFRASEDKPQRALVGRANRLRHWQDILASKALGLSVYDFGGWYAGSTDEALLGINRFKASFGGHTVAQVNAGVALSWRGWLFLQLQQRFTPAMRKRISVRLGRLRRAPSSDV